MAEPIKPIGKKDDDKPKNMGEAIENLNSTKRKIAKGILNNAGIFVGVFLVFVVIVVFTTDIKLGSFADWTNLGLAFFILLFCSYSMYVNLSDTGMRAGKDSDTYKSTFSEYNVTKKEIVEKGQQVRLLEFCRHFIVEELENTRHAILADVGVDFAVYKEKYVGASKATIKADPTLTEPQKKAVISANKVKPIKLTPEMIFKRGRGAGRRSPLDVNPNTKKAVNYVVKFVKIATTTFLTSIIVLDVIITPNWATFAACCLRLLPVIINGFMGYKMGYENIVYDTVNYMSDQIDLIHQFQQYVSEHPVSEEFSENVETPNSGDKAAERDIEEEARDRAV